MTRVFMTGLEAASMGIFTAANYATITTTQKRSGAYALDLPANAGAAKTLPAAIAEIYLRIGLYPTSLIGNSSFLFMRDSAGADQLHFGFNTTSKLIEVRRGNPVGTLIATGTHAITLDAWTCIEIYALIADSGGRAIVKLDGVLDVDFTGDTKATGNANILTVFFGGSGTSHYTDGYMDDIAVNDTAGANNNSWVGRGGIYPAFPDGAGNYTQLTPSAGANWQCVDEKPPNDDTDYVASGVTDEKDTYTLNDLVPTQGTITAVQWIGRARLEDAGAGGLARLFRIGGADYQGADLAIDTTSYKYCQEIIENNPATAAQFNVAEVNAMEAGVVIR